MAVKSGVRFVFKEKSGTHVDLRFHLYSFIEAAVLRSFVLRYAGAPLASRVSFFFSFFLFFYLEISLFPSIFLVTLPFYLCMESTSYVFPFREVFSTM